MMTAGAPYIHQGLSSRDIARHGLTALAPATILAVLWQGYGLLGNLLLASVFSFSIDWLCSRWRGLAPTTGALDAYALLPAVLLALLLPPATPWYLLLLASLFALGLAKHGFGGPGDNVFHPAMAGILFVSLAFPASADLWLLPAENSFGLAGLQHNVAQALGFAGDRTADLFSDTSQARPWLVAAPVPDLSAWALWFNIALLMGGLSLVWRGLVAWAIPLSLMSTLALCEFFFRERSGLPALASGLLSALPLLLAFFVATDASTSPLTRSAQCLFGMLIALFYFLADGSARDIPVLAMAGALLFANFCTPLLDRLLQPAGLNSRASDPDSDPETVG